MSSVPNGCSASTTFVWKKVKITAPPRPNATARAKRAPLSADSGVEKRPRKPLWANHGVIVRPRGGGELWWQLSYGGVTKRFPGHVALQDALMCLLTHPVDCAHREERFGD